MNQTVNVKESKSNIKEYLGSDSREMLSIIIVSILLFTIVCLYVNQTGGDVNKIIDEVKKFYYSVINPLYE